MRPTRNQSLVTIWASYYEITENSFFNWEDNNKVSNILAVAISGRTEARSHEGQQTDPAHQITLTQTQNILFRESVELDYRINCL
jgi:hypothetical protein